MSKKDKLKKLNARNINKKLNRKKVLNNCLKSENKGLRYELMEDLENFKEQTSNKVAKIFCGKWDTKKKLSYYKAKTRNLEADKVKKKKRNMIPHSY